MPDKYRLDEFWDDREESHEAWQLSTALCILRAHRPPAFNLYGRWGEGEWKLIAQS